MKILDTNKKNTSSNLTFKAKVSNVNAIAKKTLIKTDPRFKDIFEGKAKDFEEIKFNGKQVYVNLWGWANDKTIGIISRLGKKSNMWGSSELNITKNKDNYTNFIEDVKRATDNIAKNSNYIDFAIQKLTKPDKNKTEIIISGDNAAEKIIGLGQEFLSALTEETKRIKINGQSIKLTIGTCGEEDNLGISATFKHKPHPFGHSYFETKKPNGEKQDIKGFLKSMKQAIANLKAKEKRRTAKENKNPAV